MPDYSYNKDYPFAAFITNLGKYNEGELVGEWVKFPTTAEELKEVFKRIGIGQRDDFGNPYEEWFITDYDCYVDGLYDKLGEYESLDELNYLASKLDEMSDSEYAQFQAGMEMDDHCGSLQEIINLTENLDCYEVYPHIEDYAGLVQQIKEKSEERKKLLAEKKKTQFYQIPKLHDFTRRITELTEEIEELKTEKNFLLRSLNCADDADISDVKKEIATLEIALKKLDEQEVKYATELEDAMKQYAELNAQVADMDAVELKDARLIIRPDRERSATDRIKAAYGEKYDPVMMHDSKRDVANLLNEETGARSVRNLLRQTQKMQQMQQRREPKRHERER